MKVTLASFKKWLQDQPPDSLVGDLDSGNHHPMSHWLNEMSDSGEEYIVGSTTFWAKHAPKNIEIPEPLQKVLDIFDDYAESTPSLLNEVTAQQALEIQGWNIDE